MPIGLFFLNTIEEIKNFYHTQLLKITTICVIYDLLYCSEKADTDKFMKFNHSMTNCCNSQTW